MAEYGKVHAANCWLLGRRNLVGVEIEAFGEGNAGKQTAHQEHHPLPAVRGHQQDHRTRRRRKHAQLPDPAFPELFQVTADTVRCKETASASCGEMTEDDCIDLDN